MDVWCEEIIKRHIDESNLRWYGHVGCIVDDRMIKKIYDSMAEGPRRGRPQKRWPEAE